MTISKPKTPKTKYSFELALDNSRIADYFDLRQQIFCHEQGLFQGNDRDAIDEAQPLDGVSRLERLAGSDGARSDRLGLLSFSRQLFDPIGELLPLFGETLDQRFFIIQ